MGGNQAVTALRLQLRKVEEAGPGFRSGLYRRIALPPKLPLELRIQAFHKLANPFLLFPFYLAQWKQQPTVIHRIGARCHGP